MNLPHFPEQKCCWCFWFPSQMKTPHDHFMVWCRAVWSADVSQPGPPFHPKPIPLIEARVVDQLLSQSPTKDQESRTPFDCIVAAYALISEITKMKLKTQHSHCCVGSKSPSPMAKQVVDYCGRRPHADSRSASQMTGDTGRWWRSPHCHAFEDNLSSCTFGPPAAIILIT